MKNIKKLIVAILLGLMVSAPMVAYADATDDAPTPAFDGGEAQTDGRSSFRSVRT